MTDIWQRLKAPFPPDKVSWRIGATKKDKTSGIALAYIDARDVMERLDEVVGPDNWECRYPHAGQKTVCEISVFVGGKWIVKADGAGDSDVEAEKGALSDAFKRAAVRFGIGRYLYDLGNTWVELEARGNSHVIRDGEYVKLRAALTRLSGNEAPPPKAQGENTPLVKEAFTKIDNGLNVISQTGNLEDLKAWWTNHQDTINKLPAGYKKALTEKKDEIKATLTQKAA